MRKEAVMAPFNILFQYLAGGTHEKLQSGQLVSKLGFESVDLPNTKIKYQPFKSNAH
jgi:hypothetical protein